MATATKRKSTKAQAPMTKKTRPKGKGGAGAQVNAAGIFVRGVTKFDVPIRVTAKCTVRISLVESDDDGLWRYGYDYTFRGGGGGFAPAVDHEGFPTRGEALVVALTAASEKFQKEIDRLRFTAAPITKELGKAIEDIELCRQAQAGQATYRLPKAKEAPTAGVAKKAQVNEHGVYVRGVTNFDVPIRVTTKCRLRIRLVRDDQDGLWRASFDWKYPEGNQGGEPSTRGATYATRIQALLGGIDRAVLSISDDLVRIRATRPKIADEIRKALEDIAICRHIQAGEGEIVSTLEKLAPASKAKPSAASPPAAVLEQMAPLPLTATERKELAHYEKTIDLKRKAFLEVGHALAAIRTMRLYRDSHDSFEAYCQERWDFGRQYAYRLMDAADVVKQIEHQADVVRDEAKKLPRELPIGDILPATESQARPLAKIAEEDVAPVWAEVINRAPRDDHGKPQITAKIVETVVDEWVTPGDELAERRDKARKDAEYRLVDEWDRELNWLRKRIEKTAAQFEDCRADLVAMLRELAGQIEGAEA